MFEILVRAITTALLICVFYAGLLSLWHAFVTGGKGQEKKGK